MRKRRVVGRVVPLIFAGACLSATAAASAETTLSVTVLYGDAGYQFFQNNLVPRFEAAHPGVKVQIINGDWDTYASKVLTLYAAGQLPDVLFGGAEYLGDWAPTGIVQPIDAYARDWPDLDDFPQVELQDGTFEGKLYDIPAMLDVRTLFYRKDYFEKTGLDPDSPPETWDQLVDYAQKLTLKDDSGRFTQAGINVPTNEQVYTLYMHQAGGRLFSDLRHATVNSPQNIEAAQFMSDLINKYGVSPLGGFGWVGGGAAMEYDGEWAMTTLNGHADPEVNAALPPKGPATRSGSLYINKWFIGSQTKHPKLAWDWIAFVSSESNMAALGAAANIVPPRLSMLNHAPWSSDPRWATIYQAATLSIPFMGQVPTLSESQWDDGMLNTMLADILGNKQSAANVLNALQKRAQAQLDEAWAGIERG